MTKEMTNEITTTEGFNPSLQPVIVAEDNQFITFQQPDGKYVRKLKFHDYSSISAETREQKLNLLKLVNEADEMKKYINKEIELEGVIFKPYSSLDEETGSVDYGVTTTIITEGYTKAIVTSSKTVYMKIKELVDLFGSELFLEGDLITIIPIKEQGQKHQLTSIKIK